MDSKKKHETYEGILESERLYFRELTIHDAAFFYTLNLDQEVLKYTGDSPFRSVSEAAIFLKNYNHYQKYGFGRWVVMRKTDNEILGWCGFKYSPISGDIDIGFRFFKRFWNSGYATESAIACIDFGFAKLAIQRIIGRVMKSNLGSIRVLEKSGLVFCGEIDFDGEEGFLFAVERKA